eukprot:1094926-Pelagomonas_calceolata.AAC.4
MTDNDNCGDVPSAAHHQPPIADGGCRWETSFLSKQVASLHDHSESGEMSGYRLQVTGYRNKRPLVPMPDCWFAQK